MTPAPRLCPECKGEVPPYATACPHCPYSFVDDYGELKVPEKKKEKAAEAQDHAVEVQAHWSPVPIILAAAGALVVFGLWRLVATGGADLKRAELPSVAETTQSLPRPSTAAAPGVFASSRSAYAEPMPGGASSPGEDPGTLMVEVEAAPAEPEKPAIVVKEWKMRGFVYDVVSLAPLPSCKVVFSDVQSNTRFETATDASGRYRMILAPLTGRGYAVSLRQPGYSATYAAGDIKSLPEAARLSLAKKLATSVEAQTLAHDSNEPLVTDLYVAPLKNP